MYNNLPTYLANSSGFNLLAMSSSRVGMLMPNELNNEFLLCTVLRILFLEIAFIENEHYIPI